MINVTLNKVDLKGDKEIIAAEFISLCVCLLDNHKRMYPGHEEAILRDMLDYAVTTFRRINKEETDGREEKNSH